MAQIWKDNVGSHNNVVMSNNQENLVFKWDYITFSTEQQEAAEVRWRKMGNSTLVSTAGIRGFMRDASETAAMWSTPVSIGRLEDTTTWTLSGGQMVPPIEANRRYSRIAQIVLPMNYFSPGVWSVGVRMRSVGDADWGGYVNHKIEISDYDDRQFTDAPSGNAMVKGPAFPNEGEYGVRVEVISESGVATISAEQTFDVWSTNQYTLHNGGVQAVPEHYNNGTQTGRTKRTE